MLRIRVCAPCLMALLLAASVVRAQTEFAAPDPDPAPPVPAEQPAEMRLDERPAPASDALRVLAGLAISASAELNSRGDDPYGHGLMVAVERVWRSDAKVQPIVYAGGLATWPYDDSCTHPDNSCNVSAATVFAGAKVRLELGIPYVRPFLELGAGLSAGKITTIENEPDDREDSGLLFHIPWALGLALGSNHDYTLAFSYLSYPDRNHFDGGFVLGFDFPLGSGDD